MQSSSVILLNSLNGAIPLLYVLNEQPLMWLKLSYSLLCCWENGSWRWAGSVVPGGSHPFSSTLIHLNGANIIISCGYRPIPPGATTLYSTFCLDRTTVRRPKQLISLWYILSPAVCSYDVTQASSNVKTIYWLMIHWGKGCIKFSPPSWHKS